MFWLLLFVVAAVVPINAQVITAYNIDNTILVDGSHFPCSDVGINNALAALPSSLGTVIVPGCQGILPLSSTVTIGPGQTLILNHGTEVQPQSSGLEMFSVKAGGTLKGLWADVSNQPSYESAIISLTDNYRDGTQTTIKDILCTGGPTSLWSACLNISASSSAQSVAFVNIENVHISGFYVGVSLTTSGSGFINGNFFSDIHVSKAQFGYVFNAGGGAIAGNLLSNISYQCCASGVTSYGIYLEGSAPVSQNVFSGFASWDTVAPNVPIASITSSVGQNIFTGRFDGGIYDKNAANQYFISTLGPGGAGNINAMQLGSTIVSNLPSASSSPGMMVFVSDSTAVSTEGQSCKGGSSNKALAFSNGSVWKCF